MGIVSGSGEHSALVEEYYKGTEGNATADFKTNLMNANQKLIAKNLLGNNSFYRAASHQCDDGSFLATPSNMSLVTTICNSQRSNHSPNSLQSTAKETLGCLSAPGMSKPDEFVNKTVRVATYLVDIAVYEYDFAHSLSDGNVGMYVQLSETGEVSHKFMRDWSSHR